MSSLAKGSQLPSPFSTDKCIPSNTLQGSQQDRRVEARTRGKVPTTEGRLCDPWKRGSPLRSMMRRVRPSGSRTPRLSFYEQEGRSVEMSRNAASQKVGREMAQRAFPSSVGPMVRRLPRGRGRGGYQQGTPGGLKSHRSLVQGPDSPDQEVPLGTRRALHRPSWLSGGLLGPHSSETVAPIGESIFGVKVNV